MSLEGIGKKELLIPHIISGALILHFSKIKKTQKAHAEFLV